MMIENEYVSVPEIAKMAGVVRQTVYNRIKNEWKPFIKEIGGKTYVSIKALGVQIGHDENEFDSPKIYNNLTDVKDSESSPELSKNVIDENLKSLTHWMELVSELKDEIQRKREELALKDKEISEMKIRMETLELRIHEKDEKILELAEKFATMAEREQELTRNAQNLHALSEVKKESEKIIGESQDIELDSDFPKESNKEKWWNKLLSKKRN